MKRLRNYAEMLLFFIQKKQITSLFIYSSLICCYGWYHYIRKPLYTWATQLHEEIRFHTTEHHSGDYKKRHALTLTIKRINDLLAHYYTPHVEKTCNERLFFYLKTFKDCNITVISSEVVHNTAHDQECKWHINAHCLAEGAHIISFLKTIFTIPYLGCSRVSIVGDETKKYHTTIELPLLIAKNPST